MTDPKDGGYLVPAMLADISAHLGRSASLHMESQIRSLFPDGLPARKPLTRRERWDIRMDDYRNRVRLAVDAIRGRHDCGDW